MMSGSSKILIALAPMMAMAPLVQTVGAAERNLDRVIACADEADDARRLACYDREIAGMKPQAAKTPGAALPAPPSSVAATAAETVGARPAAAAAAATDDSFGMHGSEVARQRKSEQEQEHGPDEARSISAKVTEVSSRPRGELVLTLDNGQAWAQKKPGPYFPVKVGDAITINAGMLGSYRLVNGNRSTQVTRIR